MLRTLASATRYGYRFRRFFKVDAYSPRRGMSYHDRVRDTTTTGGTGDITLSGSAPTGYQNFSSVFTPNEEMFPYVIRGGAEWETGMGYLSATTTLVRDTVFESSNGNALVNFTAGTTKDVFCTVPADNVADVAITAAMKSLFIPN